jgi:hypothetical protein
MSSNTAITTPSRVEQTATGKSSQYRKQRTIFKQIMLERSKCINSVPLGPFGAFTEYSAELPVTEQHMILSEYCS